METKKRKFEIWGRKIKKEKEMVRDEDKSREIKKKESWGRVVKIDQEGRKGDKMKYEQENKYFQNSFLWLSERKLT